MCRLVPDGSEQFVAGGVEVALGIGDGIELLEGEAGFEERGGIGYRRRAHPDWENHHGFPGDDDDRAGREADRAGLDGDGRVGVELDERLNLDLAWRYSHIGKVRTPRGPGRVVWRDGSREPSRLDPAPTKAWLKGHGIRLSLPYAF